MPRTSLIGWTARVLSVMSLGIILLFAVGESFNPFHLHSIAALLFLFFPLGVCLGMVVGWWREDLGGAITLASIGVFYFLNVLTSGRFPRGPYFLILAVPGFLFLISWIYREGRPSTQPVEPRRPGNADKPRA